MRTRRYSITQRQAESLCAALTLAKDYARRSIEKGEYTAYWNLRTREWEELLRNLAKYEWEVKQ